MQAICSCRSVEIWLLCYITWVSAKGFSTLQQGCIAPLSEVSRHCSLWCKCRNQAKLLSLETVLLFSQTEKVYFNQRSQVLYRLKFINQQVLTNLLYILNLNNTKVN